MGMAVLGQNKSKNNNYYSGSEYESVNENY